MDTNSTSAVDSARQDGLDDLPDAVAAAAFRRLVRHLRHRHDAQNIDLMGLAWPTGLSMQGPGWTKPRRVR
jgi:uncharacterized protein